MQQAVSLSHVAGVGRCADDGVHQTRICVNSDVRLHPKMPLVAFLDLVHFRVKPPNAFGGAGCRNQSGVHHCTGLEQQALGGQLGIDYLQDLWAQLVLLEQVAKSQGADPVGNALGATDAHKVTVEVGLEQSLFSFQVRQAKPFLQTISSNRGP